MIPPDPYDAIAIVLERVAARLQSEALALEPAKVRRKRATS
jgi:hypothetical protein